MVQYSLTRQSSELLQKYVNELYKPHEIDREMFVGLKNKLFNITRVWKCWADSLLRMKWSILTRRLWDDCLGFSRVFAAGWFIETNNSHWEVAQVWPSVQRVFHFFNTKHTSTLFELICVYISEWMTTVNFVLSCQRTENKRNIRLSIL